MFFIGIPDPRLPDKVNAGWVANMQLHTAPYSGSKSGLLSLEGP